MKTYQKILVALALIAFVPTIAFYIFMSTIGNQLIEVHTPQTVDGNGTVVRTLKTLTVPAPTLIQKCYDPSIHAEVPCGD